MSRYNHHRKITTLGYVYRIAFCIISALILVLGMPATQDMTHSYRLGDPWEDGPIIATDSFRIWKSDETLEKERDSIQRHFYEPFFGIDKTVKDKQLQAFRNEFETNYKHIPAIYKQHIMQRLSEVYDRGIMDMADHEEMTDEGVNFIRIFANNTAENRSMKQVFTAKSAYEYLMSEPDTTHYKLYQLQHMDLSRFISGNLKFDEDKSEQHRKELAEEVVPYIGKVKVGEKIVDRGQIVDKYTYNILKSLEKFQKERARSTTEEFSQTAGRAIYALLMSAFLLLYFQQFRSDYLENLRTVLFVASLFLIFPLITYTLVEHQLMSVFVVPYCILPIFIRIFMDSRTAFVVHVLTLLTCAIALSRPLEFMAIQIAAGLTAGYSLRQLNQRSDLFTAVVLVILSTFLTRFCLDLIEGAFFNGKSLAEWDYIFLFIAGILSTISYLLLFAIERIFGFTSNVTLVELSNINTPILRRLSEEAPGTFQHTLQVSNLAAEVANRIGVKSQLARTGALYHDIGKLENPVFFTENQTGVNPHNELSFEESAQIIIGHVRDGLKLAEKHKLPNVIMDFIRTHHGLSMAKFFYISYKNKYPDKEVDESLFSYPGPNPQTPEQAIVMMADAVEAASRSLPEYTEESVNNLVDRIIDGQVQGGYFNNCPITFLNIQEAKEVFKSKLKTIYHTRISYPELKKEPENPVLAKKRRR